MDFDALSDDLARPFGFLPLATLMAVLLLGISGRGDGSQKQGGSGGVSPAAEPAQAGDSARPAREFVERSTTRHEPRELFDQDTLSPPRAGQRWSWCRIARPGSA